MASCLRSASSPRPAVSTPSRYMVPLVTGMRRKSVSIRLDLPLPVRPTTPQLEPPCADITTRRPAGAGAGRLWRDAAWHLGPGVRAHRGAGGVCQQAAAADAACDAHLEGEGDVHQNRLEARPVHGRHLRRAHAHHLSSTAGWQAPRSSCWRAAAGQTAATPPRSAAPHAPARRLQRRAALRWLPPLAAQEHAPHAARRTSWYSSAPDFGQPGGGAGPPSCTSGGSWGRSVKSSMRSVLVMMFSTCPHTSTHACTQSCAPNAQRGAVRFATASSADASGLRRPRVWLRKPHGSGSGAGRLTSAVCRTNLGEAAAQHSAASGAEATKRLGGTLRDERAPRARDAPLHEAGELQHVRERQAQQLRLDHGTRRHGQQPRAQQREGADDVQPEPNPPVGPATRCNNVRHSAHRQRLRKPSTWAVRRATACADDNNRARSALECGAVSSSRRNCTWPCPGRRSTRRR